ncbi:hypothetical protein LINPERHAP2_LOCUS715, partial [Linum perenne]
MRSGSEEKTRTVWTANTCSSYDDDDTTTTNHHDEQRLKFMKPSISAQGKKTVIIPKSVAQQEIWELSLVAQQLCTSTSTTGTPTQTVSLILKEANKLWTTSSFSSSDGNKIDVKELGRGGKL